jgi:hypothetical protein
MMFVFTSLIPLLNPPRAGRTLLGVQLTSNCFPPTLHEKIGNHFLHYFLPPFYGSVFFIILSPFYGGD